MKRPTEWEKIFANDTTNQGLNLQNIQTAHTAQKQKNKPNKKMGRRSKDTSLKKTYRWPKGT